MKIGIILVLICTVTSIQLERKEFPNKISAWILKPTETTPDIEDNYIGPYLITHTVEGDGLVFEGLKGYAEVNKGKEFLQRAFTEDEFNNFFVKQGENYMIPYKFFISGETENIGDSDFKW